MKNPVLFCLLLTACQPLITIDLTGVSRSCSEDAECFLVAAKDVCSGCLSDVIGIADSARILDEIEDAKRLCIGQQGECLNIEEAFCNAQNTCDTRPFNNNIEAERDGG